MQAIIRNPLRFPSFIFYMGAKLKRFLALPKKNQLNKQANSKKCKTHLGDQ